MFFDDRLATVLRQRSDSEGGARTQFRQLLDILGNRKYGRDQSLVAAAWLRMDALAGVIPASERASAIRERGWRLRSAELTAHLADSDPEVALAALERADLGSEDWTALIPRLPVRARGFLRRRNDLPEKAEELLDQLGVHDRALPLPAKPEETALSPEPEEARQSAPPSPPEAANEDAEPPPLTLVDALPEESDPTRSEISALVERIAQFRREREATTPVVDPDPRLPLGEYVQPAERKISSFGFAADVSGRIEWAEADAAPMVIGTRLVPARAFASAEPPAPIERAFARRQPISNTLFDLAGAPPIAGEWVIDAQPSFTDEGSFNGYVGRFRRKAQDDDAQSAAALEADRIRQLLHELRTPVTAVQGYAEVIQQQLFGPAPHEYRALAASIASDAARILAGFEELDRLAKLETGATEFTPGETDLSGMVARVAQQLSQVLGPRTSGLEFGSQDAPRIDVALDPDEAEALIWRFLATLAGSCAPDELVSCEIARSGSFAMLTCEVPAVLKTEENIYAAQAKPSAGAINAGLFGAGFTLRLARAEAEAAGGELRREGDRITLSLPLLTDRDGLLSQIGEASEEARAGNGSSSEL